MKVSWRMGSGESRAKPARQRGAYRKGLAFPQVWERLD